MVGDEFRPRLVPVVDVDRGFALRATDGAHSHFRHQRVDECGEEEELNTEKATASQ